MDFGFYMIPVYAIGVVSALVVTLPEWRTTGLIVFFASFLNIFFLNSIIASVQTHMGAFFMFYDGLFAMILFTVSNGQKIPIIMSIILAVFVIFHGLLEISVTLQSYSFFWREYANIILTLNLVQLSFLIWGVSSGVRTFLVNHSGINHRRRRVPHNARDKDSLAPRR